MAGELRARYRLWADDVLAAARQVCGEGLLGAVVYGSVGRDRPHDGSDIDVMLVIADLPDGRRPRGDLAERVEEAAIGRAPDLPDLSLVLRTPSEVRSGFPLLLDMVEDGRILGDTRGAVAALMAEWRRRLVERGARRVVTGESWHWDLAAETRPGEWSL